MAAFRGEVAFVLNNINIHICDCLMVFLRGEAEESIVQRHTDTTNMLRLLTELCQRPGDVSDWGLLDLTEPAAASPRFWADSAGRHAGDGHRTAGGSVDRSGSGSTWRGAPHQQQEHRLLAWLGNSGGTRGVKES